MDMTVFIPLAKSLAGAGLPALATILQSVAPPPFGLLVPAVFAGITAALGLPVDSPPAAVQAAIDAAPSAAAEKLQALEQQHSAALDWAKLQVDQNMTEEKSTSVFIAGWRPGFAWSVVIWTNLSLLWVYTGHELPLAFYTIWNPIWLAFGGMLGLRTIEKWGGVARDTLKSITSSRSK